MLQEFPFSLAVQCMLPIQVFGLSSEEIIAIGFLTPIAGRTPIPELRVEREFHFVHRGSSLASPKSPCRETNSLDFCNELVRALRRRLNRAYFAVDCSTAGDAVCQICVDANCQINVKEAKPPCACCEGDG